MRVGVLASGSGTILEAIAERGDIPIAVVVVDRACLAIDVAARFGVPAEIVERTDFSPSFDRGAYTRDVLDILERAGVELVAMAGFGTILHPTIFERYGDRIVNTHPRCCPRSRGGTRSRMPSRRA